MNGWLIALIAYLIGWVITLVLIVWDLRDTPESYNEPGEDEAAVMVMVFLWPITWVIFVVTWAQELRDKKDQKRQQYQDS